MGLAACDSAAQPGSAANLAEKAAAYMAAAHEVNQFSGAVLIAKDGAPLFEQAYGMAQAEWDIANTPDVIFRLGSVTKQFTGMAIAILQDQGKLSVSEKLCAYIENCPDAWQDITVSHLLHHTSGLLNYTSTAEFAVRTRSPMNADQLVEMLRDAPLDFPAGSSHAYSNSGYFFLGAIIEKVSGQPYAAFLQDAIFKPLGMADTGYDVSADIMQRRAAGYVRRGGQVFNAGYMDMTVPGAAGGLYSTVGDLLKWDQALYTDKLVSKATMQAVFTPHEGEAGYGYGWGIEEEFGHKKISHGGAIYGFSTEIARYTDDKLTIIVLSNVEGTPSTAIASDLAAIYFGAPYTVPVKRVAKQLPDGILQSYVGDYMLQQGMILEIRLHDGQLLAEVKDRMSFSLLASSDTEFYSPDVAITFAFVKSAAGEVEQFILNPGGEGETIAQRIESKD